MIKLEYPEPSFNIKAVEGKDMIFDPIRKRWIVLTEEEWVRQNIIQYLVQVLQYPAALIAVEKEIRVGELNKRFDILVYDLQHQPWMMIECKEPAVPLTEEVYHQLLRYHIAVPATYLVISNGHYTSAWKKEKSELKMLDQLPKWV